MVIDGYSFLEFSMMFVEFFHCVTDLTDLVQWQHR